jgi:trimethylamine corrinoid protein
MDQSRPDLIGDTSALLERKFLEMDPVGAKTVLQAALASLSRETVLEEIIVPTLERLGRQWEEGRIALSQVYMSGRISEGLIGLLLPETTARQGPQPRMAITALEDHHVLGKRIVSSMVHASGFALLDLGTTEADSLINKTLDEEIGILLISTLMLPSALKVGYVIEGLRKAGWTGKTLVGGAPFRFDDRLWTEVGADGTSASAAGAVRLVKKYAEVTP